MDKQQLQQFYNGTITLFFTLLIAVTSGFGWLFIEVAILENNVLNAMIYSYLLSSGLASVFLIFAYENILTNEEEDDN